MKQGKPNEALGHFEQVAQSTADAAIVADARYQAARLLADKGDWAKASELLAPLGQAAEPAEKVGWALALLGSCQAHLGKQTEALATFESLLTRFPEHPARADALVGMARVYRELKQPDKALEAAQKALQIAGERGAEAHFELASCYRDQGKTEEAAEEFLKVAILYGNRHWGARAQYEAGQCYEQLDRPQVAISTYEVIVRDFSDQEAVVKQAQARIDALKAG